uniref:Reverse transcriptase domain-containing protein n=1 Tax=Strongyloides venezuelensis TaxID=75913 RepID=A0A0K0G2C1_STRVS
MKSCYRQNGVDKCFMEFGGVLPVVRRLDYEVPYVDPKRICGFDGNGKSFIKSQTLGGGNSVRDDCGNTINGDTTQYSSSAFNFTEVLNLISDNVNNEVEILSYDETSTPISSTTISEDLNGGYENTPTPVFGRYNVLKLEKLRSLNTPIRPPGIPLQDYSKEIATLAPKLMEVWREYTSNIQKEIVSLEISLSFQTPDIGGNIERKDNVIACYQDKLDNLELPRTFLGPLIEEPSTIGMTHSLKENFKMYRDYYRMDKENTALNEKEERKMGKKHQSGALKKFAHLIDVFHFRNKKSIK